MANRSFRPPLGALEVDVVELFAKLTIGTSGSITASGGSYSGKGFDLIAKESAAGQYTLTLSDTYNTLLWAGVSVLDSTDSDPASVACMARIAAEDVAGANGDPYVTIQGFTTDDGADANFHAGAVVYVTLKMRNSTVS